jgi:hypothetical protein
MTLGYDTQVELLFPPLLFQDTTCAPILQRIGMSMEAKGNKILLFTDPRTVAALNAADENVKEAFRSSGIGLVLYGWNPQGRADFLLGRLRELSAQYAGEALRLAVFDLLRFVQNGMMGKINPNPFAAQLQASVPSEKFDIVAALQAMTSPEQINKPKAPDHLRASRVFGRRI